VAVWWHWPRGDARFVGKWAIYHSSKPDAYLTLHANGTARWAYPNQRGAITSWKADGDSVTFGFTAPTAIRGPVDSLIGWFNKKSRTQIVSKEQVWRALEASGDTLKMEYEVKGPLGISLIPVTLHRVPE
jgi:hypothetical protein